MSEERPWAAVITVDRVKEFHKEAIKRFHGPLSNPMDGCLEQCLGNAWSAEQYQQSGSLNAGLIFAAHLLFYLANDHCYADGNKRIAWMSAIYILRHYGLVIEADDDEAVLFMNDVASKTAIIDPRSVLDWLTSRLNVG
jgi:death-on-curing family protein